MELKRIMLDGSNLLGGKIMTVLIGFVNLIILTRILTVDEMGNYSLFLMVVNLALLLGLNWSDSAVVRHGREEFTKTGRINSTFWARMYLSVPATIIISLLMFAFSGPIADYVGLGRYSVIFILMMFLFNGVLNAITSLFQSIDQMGRSAFVLAYQKAFYLIGIALLYFKFPEAGITAVLVLVNLSFLVSIILNAMQFDFNKVRPYVFDRKIFRRVWSYSWPQLAGFSSLYIINYVDLYVIKRYADISQVGIYNVAYTGFSMICGFIMIVHSIFLPLIVEYRAKGRYGLIRRYLRAIPLLSAGWVLLALAGGMIAGYAIPFLFSDKYKASVGPFQILLIASVFYFISVCLLPVVNAFDLIIYSQAFNIIKSSVNIFADFMLVPELGIKGAAYGTVLAYLTGFLLSSTLIIWKRKYILRR